VQFLYDVLQFTGSALQKRL